MITAIIKDYIIQYISTNHGLVLKHDDVVILPTRKEFEGSHTFNSFAIASKISANPEALNHSIGKYLVENHYEFDRYNVVKGFLNITLSNNYITQFVSKSIKNSHYFHMPANNIKVMIEYSSPNTNKPLHLGHLRNNFLGYSLAQILKAAGYEVIKANLVNDRGIHICKSMLAYLKTGNGETPASSGVKGDKLVGKYYVIFDQKYKEEISNLMAGGQTEAEAQNQSIWMAEARELLQKWEANDHDTVYLWKTMNAWVYSGFEETYQKIGVNFDTTYYESDTYLLGKNVVKEGLEKGIFYQNDDTSVWVDLTEDKLDHKLLLRSDGTSVYITQDLGTADLKYADYKIDKSIYVVGNEQDYHFNVLKAILQKLGRPYAAGIYHLSYGMVDLPSGKMKSREGTVVDADDLVQEMKDTAQEYAQSSGKLEGLPDDVLQNTYMQIGLGALKYYLLKIDPKKRLLFNPSESIDFQGHTGPFIQYTHARICSIIRKAKAMEIAFENFDSTSYLMSASERNLAVALMGYHEALTDAAHTYSPALMANYVYELAKYYNTFYQDMNILQEPEYEVKIFRLALSSLVAQTIANCMVLLGIDCPEKM
ncbi:MAG: arginine--tRNA ligase [Cytophagales bacterium]|nr:arginine--tRNA ligase [Cytophagales bacterium]